MANCPVYGLSSVQSDADHVLMIQPAIEQCLPCKSGAGGLQVLQWPSGKFEILTARSCSIAGERGWAVLSIGISVNSLRR